MSTNIKTQKQGIQYTGQVMIGTQQGNKIINIKRGHNNGLVSLFKFIANCLAGTMEQTNKPSKIILYKKTATETVTPIAGLDFSETTAVTGAITYNTTPVIKLDSANNKAEVTYHFLIPYGAITGDKIYKLGLWSADSLDGSRPMAYYLFTNNAKTDWNPVELSEKTAVGAAADSKYSLIIEWTLTIENPTNQED